MTRTPPPLLPIVAILWPALLAAQPAREDPHAVEDAIAALESATLAQSAKSARATGLARLAWLRARLGAADLAQARGGEALALAGELKPGIRACVRRRVAVARALIGAPGVEELLREALRDTGQQISSGGRAYDLSAWLEAVAEAGAGSQALEQAFAATFLELGLQEQGRALREVSGGLVELGWDQLGRCLAHQLLAGGGLNPPQPFRSSASELESALAGAAGLYPQDRLPAELRDAVLQALGRAHLVHPCAVAPLVSALRQTPQPWRRAALELAALRAKPDSEQAVLVLQVAALSALEGAGARGASWLAEALARAWGLSARRRGPFLGALYGLVPKVLAPRAALALLERERARILKLKLPPKEEAGSLDRLAGPLASFGPRERPAAAKLALALHADVRRLGLGQRPGGARLGDLRGPLTFTLRQAADLGAPTALERLRELHGRLVEVTKSSSGSTRQAALEALIELSGQAAALGADDLDETERALGLLPTLSGWPGDSVRIDLLWNTEHLPRAARIDLARRVAEGLGAGLDGELMDWLFEEAADALFEPPLTLPRFDWTRSP